jgi:hypothetical protein
MSSACGRLGFAPLADDGSSSDGAGIDTLGSKVVSFGERPGATHANVTMDSGIMGSQPFVNFGGSDTVSISVLASGLLRFDVSALAPGTTIVSAELHLASASDATELMGLFDSPETWTEGAGKGTNGIANYTMRTSNQSWTDPGASPPSSRGAMKASFMPAQAGSDGTVALDPTGVQGWIDNPASNNGFIVAPGFVPGSWSFITRESAMERLRPILIVTLQ